MTDWWWNGKEPRRTVQISPQPRPHPPVLLHLGCNLRLDSQVASLHEALGPVSTSVFCYACHTTRPNHRSQFGHPNIWWRVQIPKILTAHFLLSVTPIPLADLQSLSSALCSRKPSSLNLKKIPWRCFKWSVQQNSY